MSEQRSYRSPAAFRRALTDKLKDKAKTSQWNLPQLQRQMAYDRLLERLYLVDEGWVVKGATALLARDIGVRGTIDIDLYRATAREVAEADLREAASRDIGDWFRFELGPAQPMGDETKGVRIPVNAYIGVTTWTEFHVDLVGSDPCIGLKGPAFLRTAVGSPRTCRRCGPRVGTHGNRAVQHRA